MFALERDSTVKLYLTVFIFDIHHVFQVARLDEFFVLIRFLLHGISTTMDVLNGGTLSCHRITTSILLLCNLNKHTLKMKVLNLVAYTTFLCLLKKCRRERETPKTEIWDSWNWSTTITISLFKIFKMW